MPRQPDIHIDLTPAQRKVLEQIAHSTTLEHCVVARAEIMPRAAKGYNNSRIARDLRTNRETVRSWRRRWDAACDALQAAEEGVTGFPSLRGIIVTLFTDAPRSGCPPTFTAEQLTRLIALACRPPAEFGRPVTHWTPSELAEEARRQSIVETISTRTVERFLKGGRYQTSPKPSVAHHRRHK